MRTPITWFVKNPVATNLMMWLFLAGGSSLTKILNQEEFPDIDFGIVQVSVAYLGATPARGGNLLYACVLKRRWKVLRI